MRTRDKQVIQSRLLRDSVWSAYALADLDEGPFADCDWYVGERDSLALVYKGLEGMRPLFLIGPPEEVLPEVEEAEVYLNLLPGMLEVVSRFYTTDGVHEMYRMRLVSLRAVEEEAEVLTRDDEAEVRELYQLGGGLAFAASQLDTGYFRGVRDGGRLACVAGVHLASKEQGVAAIGNVFTHPDCRGRGFAARAVSAVANALQIKGIETIVLNVEATNSGAIRLYERLGFERYCNFLEGSSRRK